MMGSSKPRGLGRGLSALMANLETTTNDGKQDFGNTEVLEQRIPIEKLHPNINQPRKKFNQDDLEDLASSIRVKGVLQPLIARKHPFKEDEYEIVAGERRWRASQMAQLHQLPVILREFSDIEVLEVAIIENIQRADLNPIEEAMGYQQLMDKFDHTQEQMANALGKSRSHIANLLRLLSLPSDVQDYVKEGKLTSGHARALITSDNANDLAQLVVSNKLSVRETEQLAKNLGNQKSSSQQKKSGNRPISLKDPDTRELEGDLSKIIGMKVQINNEVGKESGEVIISYSSLNQLDDICRLIDSFSINEGN